MACPPRALDVAVATSVAHATVPGIDTQGRRTELLDGAVDWVLEHGVGGLSLRPLADALGTSDRMLVYHFRSKDELVDAVLVGANLRLVEAVRFDLVRPEAGVRRLVEQLWRRLSREDVAPYLRLFFELYGLALQRPDRYRPFLAGVASTWLFLVEDLLSQAGVRPPSRRQRLATLVVGGLEGLLLDLLVVGDRRRVDAAARDLAAAAEHLTST